ncbi:MAG: hypothetical protein L6R41_002462 [Letrouitia leprolyta]|nr:MAG: hypothetical protein L6R41_002462 [Letrouitia leprolyta]
MDLVALYIEDVVEINDELMKIATTQIRSSHIGSGRPLLPSLTVKRQTSHPFSSQTSAAPSLYPSTASRSPVAVILPCFMVAPPRDEDFIAHGNILQTLDSNLLPPLTKSSSDSERSRTAILSGGPGTGKTSLATEFVYSRRDSFDAVFWIAEDDPAILEYDFAQIAIILGIQDPTTLWDPVKSRQLFMSWLKYPRKVVKHDKGSDVQEDAQWLLVLDDPQALKDYLKHWPTSKNGSILITIRDPAPALNIFPEAAHIEVKSLEDQDLARLKQRFSRKNYSSYISSNAATRYDFL